MASLARLAGLPALVLLFSDALAIAKAAYPARTPDGGVPRPGGRRGGRQDKEKEKESLSHLLQPGMPPHPNDPHEQGFEPRPSVEESGDIWTFGRAHAALHHVLQDAREGDTAAAARSLGAFSMQHGLDFGLDEARGLLLDHCVRQAAQELALAAKPTPATGSGAVAKVVPAAKGVHVLVLGARLGGSTLWCLPALLEADRVGGQGSKAYKKHEVVSVERDAHLSGSGQRLVSHALGANGTKAVAHTPLMPGEETTIHEVLETLGDGYELGPFDVVVLQGQMSSRVAESAAADASVGVASEVEPSKKGSVPGQETREEQIAALLDANVLRYGSQVLVDSGGTDETEYVRSLRESGFDHEVHSHADGRGTIVATFKGHTANNEL